MAWTGIRGGDALPRSSAFLFALAQVQVDPLVWGGQATPDPATLAPLARSPSYRRRTDALTRLASTGRAPASLVTYGSFSGPRYYRPWSAPGGGAVPMTPVAPGARNRPPDLLDSSILATAPRGHGHASGQPGLARRANRGYCIDGATAPSLMSRVMHVTEAWGEGLDSQELGQVTAARLRVDASSRRERCHRV